MPKPAAVIAVAAGVGASRYQAEDKKPPLPLLPPPLPSWYRRDRRSDIIGHHAHVLGHR